MIAAGDIGPRQDGGRELYVAVLSNSIHLAANTGRVITCPYIPGPIPDDTMAMVVAITQPEGTLLPELVQWLPTSALGEPIGTAGPAALRGGVDCGRTDLIAGLIAGGSHTSRRGRPPTARAATPVGLGRC